MFLLFIRQQKTQKLFIYLQKWRKQAANPDF